MTQRTRSVLETLTLGVIAVVAVLLGFAGTTYAATGAVAAADAMPSAETVYKAIMAGHYWYAAAAVLVFGVAVIQKYGEKAPVVGRFLKWTSTSWGAPLLVALSSVTGALATALAAGAAPSLSMLWAALGIAVGAGGAWKFGKELAAPFLRWLQPKLPAPVRPLISILLWVFEKPDPVTTAEAAGDAAVKANPAPGIESLTGKPRVWP